MTSARIEPTAPTAKKKLLILLPGILGNPDIDYLNMKSYLSSEYSILKWTDPRNGKKDDIEKLLNTRKKKQPFSFEFIAKFIVDGILKASPQPDEPILLLGYSFGGMLLSEIINQLKERGRIVYAYCIDAAPPITANKYFESGKVDATNDLIAICDTIARELNASKLPEKYTNEDLLRTQPITTQLTNIALDYKNADETIVAGFNHRIGIVEQNIRALLKYNPTNYRQPDAFHVGMTAETLRKYATSADGDWGTYWKSLTNLSSTLLPGTHRTLLNSEHAPTVATDILGFFTRAFKLQAQATMSSSAISTPIAPVPTALAATNSFSSSQLSSTSAFINTELKSKADKTDKTDKKSPLKLPEDKQSHSSLHSRSRSSSPVTISFGLSPYDRHTTSPENKYARSLPGTDQKATDQKADVKVRSGYNR